MLKQLGLLVGLTLLQAGTLTHACGVNTKCMVGERYYFVRMPAKHDGVTPVGALIFVHGYKGSGRNAVRSKGIASIGRRMNAAIISVKSARDDWSIPNAPSSGASRDVDEIAYFDRVMDDVSARFPIERNRVIVIGSSAGAMMTWTLACHRGDRYAGFIPVSGTFWAPIPKTCSTPAGSVVHIHGTRDKVVPLGGRKVHDARQGNVRDALAMYMRHGRFSEGRPKQVGRLRCVNRHNDDGHVLNFCLFDGGHTFNIRHVQRALDMLTNAGRF